MTISTTWGDARAKQVLAESAEGDPSELERLLLVLRDDAWDDRAFYADVIGSELPLAMLDAWCDADPDSSLAFLLRGRRMMELAWDMRGGKVAAETSRRALAGFEEWLTAAEADLLVAIDLDPGDPTPLAFQLTVLQGTGRALTQGADVLAEIRRLAPTHFVGHHAMLRAMTAKWGGSHELMFGVAREAEARGGALPLMQVAAHLERWIAFQMAGDPRGAKRYGADDNVRGEVARVVRAAYDSGAIGPNRAASALPVNILAFWAFLTEEVELLRWVLDLVGTTLTPYPWIYLDGVDTFEAARRAARG